MSEEKIALPKGWTIRENPLVGYDFLYKGELVIQHPKDSPSIRKYINIIHREQVEKE